jgi:NAD(P)-dependent dehydrogenase (short-subunit alcohol dehydrogenase family)
VQCDLRSTDSIQQLVDTVKQRHGYINLLVNNAGVALNMMSNIPTPQSGDIKGLQAALLAGPRDDFATTFDINITAAYYTTVMFLELLDTGNKCGNMKGYTSQVITVSSVAGFRRDEKVFTMSYTLSKGAAIHLGKLLANYLKDWQIRSNVIAPGVFPSGQPCRLLPLNMQRLTSS